MAEFPALADVQREWDALPQREKLRQRLAHVRKYTDWGHAAQVGVILYLACLLVAGLIVKYLVPGGSEWMRQNIDLLMFPLAAPLLVLVLGAAAGWVTLPFILLRALWRRLRS